MKLLHGLIFVLISLFSFSACQSDDDRLDNPLDIIDINDITSNAESIEVAELGRLLFWDPILSGEKDVACATCHHPDFGYADGRALPIGVGGQGLGPTRIDILDDDIGLVKRNSPTIINTAFNGMNDNGAFDPTTAPMFWDNRAFSLESQALMPLESFEEMRGHAFDEGLAVDSIVSRLQSNAEYRNLFASAFGNTNAITSTNIGAAIASFERTIVATDSPFDQFQAGDENALSPNQIRGMNRFRQIGCDDCHTGPMFSDYQLHVLGVPDHNQLEESDSGANGTYAFRTASLRNLGFTAPYFHNGTGGNLQQTIQFYITARNFARNNNGGGGGNGGPGGGLAINPNVDRNEIDEEVEDLNNFNNDDVQDIVAFLEALNDPDFDKEIPTSVPSGLTPGGRIE